MRGPDRPNGMCGEKPLVYLSPWQRPVGQRRMGVCGCVSILVTGHKLTDAKAYFGELCATWNRFRSDVRWH